MKAPRINVLTHMFAARKYMRCVGLPLLLLVIPRSGQAQATAAPAVTSAGATPVLFAAGTVSTMFPEWNTSFTPDGRNVFFSRGLFWTIMVSTRVGMVWSAPEVAPFSGKWLDTDPFVSPDGRRLYFVSNRPMDGDSASPPSPTFNIWYVERAKGGNWLQPINVGSPINGHGSVWFPAVTRDGTLYFHAHGRDGGKGSSDIFYARWAGDHYADPVPVDFNTAASEQEPYVSPDESYMIFVSDRKGGFGGGDLYISFRSGQHWSAPVNLGQAVNSSATDMAPSVSPDGTRLYFTSVRLPFRGVRPHRVDATAFTKELTGYENGNLKMYSIALDTTAMRVLRNMADVSTPGS